MTLIILNVIFIFLTVIEIPCTFEQYQPTCGWQDYPSSTLQGKALDRKWFINSREMRYYNSAGTDHTFANYKGKEDSRQEHNFKICHGIDDID